MKQFLRGLVCCLLSIVTAASPIASHNIEEKCKDIPNGMYPLRHLQRFMVCTNRTSYLGACSDSDVFNPSSKLCVPLSNLTEADNRNSSSTTNTNNTTTNITTNTNNTTTNTITNTTNTTANTNNITANITTNTNNTTTNITTNTNNTTNNDTTHLIDAKTLQAKLVSGDVILVDVRMPWELISYGKIAQSINIPLPDIKEAFTMNSTEFKERYHMEKPSLDDCNLVFHCKSGVRSQRALDIAKELGYTCAKSLEGGFEAWKNLYVR